MKLRFCFFLTFACACIFSTLGYDFSDNGIYYTINEDGNTVTLSKFYYASGDITIPSTVYNNGTNFTVTSIGDQAFYNCSGLTSVTIGNSVTSIGSYAFYNCSGLTSVTIGNSVTSIGNNAFQRCEILTQVDLGGAVSIGKYAFRYCYNLRDITIPRSVSFIDGNPFTYCYNLSSIQVEEGNGVYDSRGGCNAIIETATNKLISASQQTIIPDGVLSIGAFAFAETDYDSYAPDGYWTGRKAITIPNSVQTIEKYALEGNRFLENITIGESVSTMENCVFYGCERLKHVSLPNSLTNIGNTLFWDCSRLESVDLPSSLPGIPNTMFYCCSSLKKINIPEGAKYIGRGAFWECESLEAIHVSSTVDSICGNPLSTTNLVSITVSPDNKVFDSRNNCNALIETATNRLICGSANTRIPDGIKTIEGGAFSGCPKLTSIYIPSSVDSLVRNTYHEGYSIFDDCPNLGMIVVDPDNKRFDSRDNCNALIDKETNSLIAGCKNTSIPPSVTSILPYAFSGSGIQDIVIPNSVKKIGIYAFENCHKLNSITLSNSIDTIQNYTFSYCDNLESIIIPNSVKTIRGNSFYNCSRLKKVVIPHSVDSIGDNAFYGCDALAEVHCLATTPPRFDKDPWSPFGDNSYSTTKVYVPQGCIDTYRQQMVWENFDRIMEFENFVGTQDMKCYAGQKVSVPLKLFNAIGVTGLQADITLQDSLSFALDEEGNYGIYLTDRATRRHSIGSKLQSDGSLRILTYSSDNNVFKDSDGDLVNISIEIPKEMPDGKYGVNISNIEMVDPNGQQLFCPPVIATLDVKYAMPGDANHDCRVSIADVIAASAFALGYNPTPFVFTAADVNEDNRISVADVVSIAGIVLGRNPKAQLPQAIMSDYTDALNARHAGTSPTGTQTIALSLDNTASYTAFQTDIALPEGLSIKDVKLSSRATNHQVATNTLADGKVRIMVYSLDNSLIAGHDGDLIYIDIDGNTSGDIVVSNALFCESTGCEHELTQLTISPSQMSGITDIQSQGSNMVNVYTTTGQIIRQKVNPTDALAGLPAGIYIVNNKKVTVK